MSKNLNKKCDICGRVGTTANINNQNVCIKHYHQFRTYGKYMDNNARTVNDLNNIYVKNDIAYMELYDKFGNVIYTTKFDKEFIDIVKVRKWRISKKKSKKYVVSGSTANKQVYLANLILDYYGGEDIDHIDGNPLNNLKSNLRIIGHNLNARNTTYKNNNKTKICGVSYCADDKYHVSICINKQKYHPHCYNTLEEATYCRYLLELKLNNEYRYIGNDNRILHIISKLSNIQKKEIEQYVNKLIKEKYENNNI